MYLFYGDEKFLIQKQIKQITNKSNLEILFFNEESSIEDLIYSITTISLNGEKNNIIINNLDLIINQNNPIKKNLLFKVIKEYHDLNQLFFTIFNSKINQNDDLIKFLLSNSQVFNYKNNISNFNLLIKNIVKQNNGVIDDYSVKILLEQLPENIGIITNHIQKLLLYDKNINLNSISILKNPVEKENTFGFINAFSQWDIKKLWLEYQIFKENEGDVSFLISMISNYLDIVVNLFIWKKNNKKENNNIEKFASKINVPLFRIKKNNNFLNKIGFEKLKKIIINLSILDQKIKSGKIDKNLGFNFFLIKLLSFY